MQPSKPIHLIICVILLVLLCNGSQSTSTISTANTTQADSLSNNDGPVTSIATGDKITQAALPAGSTSEENKSYGNYTITVQMAEMTTFFLQSVTNKRKTPVPFEETAPLISTTSASTSSAQTTANKTPPIPKTLALQSASLMTGANQSNSLHINGSTSNFSVSGPTSSTALATSAKSSTASTAMLQVPSKLATNAITPHSSKDILSITTTFPLKSTTAMLQSSATITQQETTMKSRKKNENSKSKTNSASSKQPQNIQTQDVSPQPLRGLVEDSEDQEINKNSESSVDAKKNKKTNKSKKQGQQGPSGPPGPKGDTGPPGNCSCDGMDSSPPLRMQAAVSVVLTKHFGPDKDVIIPFDLELIDIADNYDNFSGVFFCSIPGTYVISVYLMSHPSSKVNARVFVNSRPVAALWADDNKQGGFYPSSSIQTISRLEFGDQVYVMLVDGGYGESWVHANYNVFTVFLLYEDFFGL